ncbi:MAG: plasmid pRiA4b ORF-3 family protein [Syntrophobacteraceae bacterium]
MKNIKFSPEQKQVLREIIIDESGPGTILRDFDTLLNFLLEGDLPITVTHQLPIRVLPEINARLTHPLQQGLRRPQQKSYPLVNGLYLLLRASGLTLTGGTSRKPLLFIDKAIHQAWKSLNPTEQYCTLLETWLLRGKPDIIGESGNIFLTPDHFQKWMYFFEYIPGKGLRIAGKKDAEDSLRYFPGWYNLGLLELFGLISVRNGPPVEGKAWSIEHVYRTPLGEALMALLFNEFFANLDKIWELEDKEQVSFGVLQPILQPFFPDWSDNLPVPEWIFREGTHIFKVSMGGVWCRIAIPADLTLDTLASAILDAVGFDDDHLYQFSYKNRFGSLNQVNHPYMEEGPWTSEVLVGDLPLPVGQLMTYLFDFGDMWEFEVALEQVDPDMDIEEMVLLELHGKPPEQYPRYDEE